MPRVDPRGRFTLEVTSAMANRLGTDVWYTHCNPINLIGLYYIKDGQLTPLMFATYGNAVLMATNIAIRSEAGTLGGGQFTLSSRCATDALRPTIDKSIIHLTGTHVTVVLIETTLIQGMHFFFLKTPSLTSG